MKEIIWNGIDNKAWDSLKKQKCFLVCLMLFSAAAGACLWTAAFRERLPETAWLLCFAGWPAVIAFLDGMLFLARWEKK